MRKLKKEACYAILEALGVSEIKQELLSVIDNFSGNQAMVETSDFASLVGVALKLAELETSLLEQAKQKLLEGPNG